MQVAGGRPTQAARPCRAHPTRALQEEHARLNLTQAQYHRAVHGEDAAGAALALKALHELQSDGACSAAYLGEAKVGPRHCQRKRHSLQRRQRTHINGQAEAACLADGFAPGILGTLTTATLDCRCTCTRLAHTR